MVLDLSKLENPALANATVAESIEEGDIVVIHRPSDAGTTPFRVADARKLGGASSTPTTLTAGQAVTAGKILTRDDVGTIHLEGSGGIEDFIISANTFEANDEIVITADDPSRIRVIGADGVTMKETLSTTANPIRFTVLSGVSSGGGLLLRFVSSNKVYGYPQNSQDAEASIEPLDTDVIVSTTGNDDYLLLSDATASESAGTAGDYRTIGVRPGSYTETAPILPKTNTKIEAQSGAVHTFRQDPNADNETVIQINSPIDVFNDTDVEIDGGEYIAFNTRYGLHNEKNQVAVGVSHVFRNMIIEHRGNGEARTAQGKEFPNRDIWTDCFAQAGGECDGGTTLFENCVFKSPMGGASMHDQAKVMATAALIEYNNCEAILAAATDGLFEAGRPYAYRAESITRPGNLVTPMNLTNCKTNAGWLTIKDSATSLYDATNCLDMSAEPITVVPALLGSENNISYGGNRAGEGDRFKHLSLAVRFNDTSVASDLFINDGQTGDNAKQLLFGASYARKNLGFGNASFSHGSVDVNGGRKSDLPNKLADRLGDCSTTAKSFRIGNSLEVRCTIDFTGQTNAQVLSYINSNIYKVSDGTTINYITFFLYSQMTDWRPRIDNFTTDYTAGESESVVPGQLVTLPNGRLAVGWEYISQNGTGKVLTGGKVSEYTASQAARDAITAQPNNTDLTVETIDV